MIEGTQHAHNRYSFVVENRVAVIELKDRAIDVLINLKQREELFELLTTIEESPDVDALIHLVASDYPGDQKHREILEAVTRDATIASKHAILIARMGNTISQLALRLAQYSRPLVAGFEGHISADELGVFLTNDFRFAAEDCQFRFPNLRLGFPASGPLAYYLVRYLGQGKAAEILLNDRSISAREARALGLVTDLVPSKHLKQRCLEQVGELRRLSPLAVVATRQMIQPEVSAFADFLNRSTSKMRTTCTREAFSRNA
jgi:enoyl-CoA hydratase/carnithine racemase